MSWSNSRGTRRGQESVEREKEHRLALIAARKAAGLPLNESGPGSADRPQPSAPRLAWQDKLCEGWED